MRCYFRFLMALGLLFSSNNNLLYSQSNDTLTFLEKQLANNYSNIQKADEFTRYKLAENFYSEMVLCLNTKGSFDFSFTELNNIGSIYSADRRIRIFTWNIPYGIADNLYYGIIQFYSPRTKSYLLAQLNRPDSLIAKMPDGSWHGALYYSIVETKHAGRKYYTLLGYDLNTPLSNKKLIEMISIDDFDELYFCEKLINYEGRMVNRIVFEYNEKAVMSLKYNENLKMIVFDHLSPSRPSLTGKYEFYGPDFTYDGLKWEKGIWMYYSNINVTN